VGTSVHRLATVALCVLAAACSNNSGGGHPSETGIADASPTDAGPADATVTDAASLLDGTLDSSTSADAANDAIDAAPAAGDGGVTGCTLDSFMQPTELRCTGLYSDWPSRTIAPGVIEYDPGLHLWSDGAVKTRWIYLPPGTAIDTANMDEWMFPVGTKVWKQFIVGGQYIETRMIHKLPDRPDSGPYAGTWYLTTYQWSADASSTSELTVGALNANDAGYEIPSQAKCSQCHGGRLDDVLGFEAVSLSSPDAGGLPIQALIDQSLLTDPPDAALVIPGDPIQAAALGYLHTNCGVPCHNRGTGLAQSTGFYMRLLAADLATIEATDTYQTGWNQPTVGFHLVPDRLSQCNAPASCVYDRMSHRDPLNDAGYDTLSVPVQMPPIDSHMVDPTGVAAVVSWINEGCDAAVPLDAGEDGD